jgi:hypothetical protein
VFAQIHEAPGSIASTAKNKETTSKKLFIMTA